MNANPPILKKIKLNEFYLQLIHFQPFNGISISRAYALLKGILSDLVSYNQFTDFINSVVSLRYPLQRCLRAYIRLLTQSIDAINKLVRHSLAASLQQPVIIVADLYRTSTRTLANSANEVAYACRLNRVLC